MPLAAGTCLGPYEIRSAIGAGGMGEVYKARDTRLDRTVAIKILSPALAADPQLRERFDREARAISHLSHPHICTLYDVGTHDGTAFLVMELLEGETLADRLTKGALPPAQALTIAVDVASALDAAHRVGIVHRDLKPGNVMLTRAGAKLLDFGLAKTQAPAVRTSGTMVTATSPHITVEGTILGTFQYMAPEQIEGGAADARSDVFAFGCVLFEMLAGKRAFEGKTPASLIGAILRDDPPPVSQLQPVAPTALDHIVKTCLAKDPDDRWQSARDLRRELQWVAGGGGSLDGAAGTPSRAEPRPAWSRAVVWTSAAAAVAFAIAWPVVWMGVRTPPAVPNAPVRFLLSEPLPAPPISETFDDQVRTMAISPDGRQVVYAAVGADGVRRLYLRDLQSLETKPIVGTENALDPFFAPDGRRLGFWSGDAIKITGTEGGSPVALVRGLQRDRGATWAPDDTIIYSPSTDAGLYRLPIAGGTPQIITTPDATKHERSYRWPQMLPDGDTVLFTIATSDIQSFDDARIAVRSLRTGEQHDLLRGGSFPTYAAPGYLLFARAGTLQAVRFNPAKTAVEGTPTTVVDGIATYPSVGAAAYALSYNGTLVYLGGGAVAARNVLTWVDRSGRATRLSAPALPYISVRISPDGRSAALDIDAANASIWVLEFARSTLTRLTLDWSNNQPFWTPDGARIAFASARPGARSLFWQRIEGPADMEPLTPDQFVLSVPQGDFSPDGRTLAIAGANPSTGSDVWIRSVDDNREARPFVQSRFNEAEPRFSPNGRWLAYVSDESGRYEVYAQPFPGPGPRVRISTDGGGDPIWSRDGHELFYGAGPLPAGSLPAGLVASVMSVRVTTGAVDLSPQPPERLFTRATTPNPYSWDVAPDGRFLWVEPLETTVASTPIAVVLNWTEELKAKVPIDRR